MSLVELVLAQHANGGRCRICRHLWPDADEATRAAVERALVAGADFLRTREVVA